MARSPGKTGLPVKRIHYYERRGLVEPASRSEAGYRLYTEEEVAKLEFVKRAKLLGLTLEEIVELVSAAEGCNEGQILPRIEEVLEEKIAQAERKIAELSAFREGLIYYRQRANSRQGSHAIRTILRRRYEFLRVSRSDNQRR